VVTTLLLLSGFTIITIIVNINLQKTFLTAATFYWAGWIFTLVAGLYAEARGLLQAPIHEDTYDLIIKANIGAFLGFMLASAIVRKARGSYTPMVSKYLRLESFVRWGTPIVAIIIFTFGFLALRERIGAIGLSMFFYEDARTAHVEGVTNESLLARIAIYCSILSRAWFFAMGLNDGLRQKVNLKRILIMVLAGAPLALVRGSRLFLFIGVISYTLSYFLILQARQTEKGLSSRVILKTFREFSLKILPYVAAGFIVFALLGYWKTISKQEEGSFWERNIATQSADRVFGWFASSLPAILPLSKEAELGLSPGYGRDFFEQVTKLVDYTGITSYPRRYEYYLHRQSIREQPRLFLGLGNVPGTIIVFAVRDSSISIMPVYLFLIAFILQFITTGIPRTGIILHVIGCIGMSAAFFACQKGGFVDSANVWTIIFTILIAYTYNRVRHKLSYNAELLKQTQSPEWYSIPPVHSKALFMNRKR